MPVRIYDISKKLGLENKEVLAKAKELGISAARVASSSLDKITAEYLEQQLIQQYPDRFAPPPAAPPAPVAPSEPIGIVTSSAPSPPPPTETSPATETVTATATALMEPPEAPAVEAPPLPEPVSAPAPVIQEPP